MFDDIKGYIPVWIEGFFGVATTQILLAILIVPLAILDILFELEGGKYVYGVPTISLILWITYPLTALASVIIAWRRLLWKRDYRLAFWMLYVPRVHIFFLFFTPAVWETWVTHFTDWA